MLDIVTLLVTDPLNETTPLCYPLRSGLHEIPTMIRTFPHGFENNHACKWFSDNFLGILTNVLFPEICIKSFCMHGCSPIHVEKYFSKHRPSGPMLSISLNIRPSVRPSVCVFTFEVPFKRLFAPTFRSRMSNIFTDSESLGKSNGKKWSQIGTFLFGNDLKLRRKKLFFCLILPYKTW